MPTRFGVHSDGPPYCSVEDLQELGVSFIRSIAYKGSEEAFVEWIDSCAAVDIEAIPVVTWNSFPDRDPNGTWREADYTDGAQEWATWLGDKVSHIVVANEPDQVGPSSWTMRTSELNGMLRAFRKAFPDATIIGPGLASGRGAEYLRGICTHNFPDDPAERAPWMDAYGTTRDVPVDLTCVDIINYHPYGAKPSPNWPSPDWGFGWLENTLGGLADFGKPLAAMEFSTDASVPEDEPFQAEYLARMLKRYVELDTYLVCWFAFSDGAVPPLGLVYDDGSRKQSFYAYQDFLEKYKAGLESPGEEESMTIEQFEVDSKYKTLLGPRWLGKPVQALGGGVRIAGYAHHVLFELNGEIYPIHIDDSFFK